MAISSAALRAHVIGGGLAGSEAAWQLAHRGVQVTLHEMRPEKSSPAHKTGALAELVCSNSLGAESTTSPGGILKQEMKRLDSLVVRCAEQTRVPAGRALAVDRDLFSSCITHEIERHPNIELVREEVTEIPAGPAIVAAGPLLAGALADAVRALVGADFLSFFDAAAPILTLESVDMRFAFRGSRYGQGDDYVNCPLDEAQYEAFCRELVAADRVPLHEVDFRGELPPEDPDETRKQRNRKFFEGCLPVEIIAGRGPDTLRYGPMRPVGLPDPETGREPYAVVQLRRDNADGTLYNMVGFQTNLRWPEQERVFRMIPALRNAEFVRKGVMHRNTFVCAPKVLDYFLRPKGEAGPKRADLFLAGQLTGVEGYAESAACGLVAAIHLHRVLCGLPLTEWPQETAVGSLLHYLQTAQPDSFQPMNVNLGIFPPLESVHIVDENGKRRKRSKPERSQCFAARSAAALEKFLESEPQQKGI